MTSILLVSKNINLRHRKTGAGMSDIALEIRGEGNVRGINPSLISMKCLVVITQHINLYEVGSLIVTHTAR